MTIAALIEIVLAAFTAPALAFWPVYLGVALLAVMIIWLIIVVLERRNRRTLERALSDISYERLSHVVLPKADDGEIHIDHILLTEHGIMVVDAKDVSGVVFGSDRMHDWTVMDRGRRYTIANPQAALFDRVAAVKLVVTDVPVEGRIVFGAQADFSKGVPSLVCTEVELLSELPKVGGNTNSQTRAAFLTEWQKLREAAQSGVGGLVG